MKQSNSKQIINSTVINMDNIEFVGFSKILNKKDVQKIDVFIDQDKIATITADGPRELLYGYSFWDLFDIEENHCFSYKLPQEYQNQVSSLRFENQNGEDIKISKSRALKEKEALSNLKNR